MSDTRPARELDKVIIRLPDGVRDRLGALARENGRSVNAEVVKALEAWLVIDPQAEPGFVHLPETIRDRVAVSANLQRRSILDEVVARLAASFEPEGPRHADDSRRDLRAELRDAMHEAVEGLLSDPERLKRLGYQPARPADDEAVSG